MRIFRSSLLLVAALLAALHLAAVDACSEYAYGVHYDYDEYVTYNGNYYRCKLAHTAHSGWDPELSGSWPIWAEVTQSQTDCDSVACADSDADSICNTVDSCANDANNDADDDGLCGNIDSCPTDSNNDVDEDWLCDGVDSCPNDDENDGDGDGVCDGADSCQGDAGNDVDGDGLCALSDSCPLDTDNDADSDDVCGNVDSCPTDSDNDTDSDDVCGNVDSCPTDAENDVDGDTFCAEADTCPHDASNDIDGDNVCADVDACPFDEDNDTDSDDLCGNVDSCPTDAENDADGDTFCAEADTCPHDASNDIDGDNVCADVDACPFDEVNDTDSDDLCGNVDSCPTDAENDVDSDEICATDDSCPRDSENDRDSDNLCAWTDSCSEDPENDIDSDTVCSNVDSCPWDFANDADSDGLCADDDSCPIDPRNDADGDGICDSQEWCPEFVISSVATTKAFSWTEPNAWNSDIAPTAVHSAKVMCQNSLAITSGVTVGQLHIASTGTVTMDAECSALSILANVESHNCSSASIQIAQAFAPRVNVAVRTDAFGVALLHVSCAPGYMANNPRMRTQNISCLANFDSIFLNCTACPTHSFLDDASGQCVACPNNSFTAGEASSSIAGCQCRSGVVLGGNISSCACRDGQDADSDGLCSHVDSCDEDSADDQDSDFICGNVDVCPADDGNDIDSDLICYAVDSCPQDAENDADSDNACDSEDPCAYDADNDRDSDLICADNDSCVNDADNDADIDAICGDVDSCPFDPDNDSDSDELCADFDSCEHDNENDSDSDGVCGNVDECRYDAENDADSDGVCGDLDTCSYDAENDSDSDFTCGDQDSCPTDANNDLDSDSMCSDQDICARDAHNDGDSDSICGDIDSCPRDRGNDEDSDSVCADTDSCDKDTMNDLDSDSICGDIDSCEYDVENDIDSDALCGNVDSCERDADNDADSDNICSPTDSCHNDAENDQDSDLLCGDVDSCRYDAVNDADSDSICAHVDTCPMDADDDADSDRLCANVDSCQYDAFNDVDSDAVCGNVDSCAVDRENDFDGDNVCGNNDSCVRDAENDADSDAVCGDQQRCSYDAENDADSDRMCGNVDSCADDADNDADSDALCGNVDSCQFDAANDADSDLLCADIDSCAKDTFNDQDSDHICGDVDSCERDAGNDEDSDFLCSAFDSCALDAENDVDSDSVCGNIDSCEYDSRNDVDSDNICAPVDSCPVDGRNDADSDTVCGEIDSCPNDLFNDVDGDLLCGDMDSCELDSDNDADHDGLCSDKDSCVLDAQNDKDSDLICGNADSCSADPLNDVDQDSICGEVDSCALDEENDADSDQFCLADDPCPWDALNDRDSDIVCDGNDKCLNDAANDADSDGICDGKDSCLGDALNDFDSDGICDTTDSCLNDSVNDADSDGICDLGDSCPGDPGNDVDQDGLCELLDSCVSDAENDADSDSFCSSDDEYPYDPSNSGFFAAIEGLTPAGSNVSVNASFLLEIVSEFAAYVESDASSSVTVSQDIEVLSTLIPLVGLAGDDELLQSTLDALVGVGVHAFGPTSDSATESADALASFLEVVDDFVAVTNSAISTVVVIESVLEAICAGTADLLANSNATAVTSVYNFETYRLSCIGLRNSSDALFFETDEASLVLYDSSDIFSVALTGWDVNSTNTTTLLSGSQGVSVSTISGDPVPETDDIDAGFQISIQIVGGSGTSDSSDGDGDSTSLRKQIACSFFDEDRNDWNARGVYLRGIDVYLVPAPVAGTVTATSANGNASESGKFVVGASAICISTHLTLFAVADESEAVAALETKVAVLQKRFQVLSAVDLLDADTTLNPLVPSLFGCFTFLFVVTVIVAKKRKARDKVVAEARLVYAQYGRLSRPAVIGGDEFEAILRGWLSAGQVAGMVLLQVLSVNPFLALFFRWSHEHIVFTQADKAFLLYGGVMSTFLVQAFLFDTAVVNADDADDAGVQKNEFSATILNILIGALFANILLFPVQYFLPFMISNVNSFSTSTATPQSLVRQQFKKLAARCSGCANSGSEGKTSVPNAIARQKNEEEISITVLKHWWELTAESQTGLGDFLGPNDNGHRSVVASKNAQPALASMVGATSVAAKVRNKADRWQVARRINKELSFLSWRVKLPTHAEIRGEAAAERGFRRLVTTDNQKQQHDNEAAEKAVANNFGVSRTLKRLQARLKDSMRRRRMLRHLEFDAWYKDCKPWRMQLTVYNVAFLATLALFTLMVCILLSAAFNNDQCVSWVFAVLQSIAMQVLVTGPLFGLTVLCVKLILSSLLLQVSARVRKIERERANLAKRQALASRCVVLQTELQQLQTVLCSGGSASFAARSKELTLQEALSRTQQEIKLLEQATKSSLSEPTRATKSPSSMPKLHGSGTSGDKAQPRASTHSPLSGVVVDKRKTRGKVVPAPRSVMAGPMSTVQVPTKTTKGAKIDSKLADEGEPDLHEHVWGVVDAGDMEYESNPATSTMMVVKGDAKSSSTITAGPSRRQRLRMSALTTRRRRKRRVSAKKVSGDPDEAADAVVSPTTASAVEAFSKGPSTRTTPADAAKRPVRKNKKKNKSLRRRTKSGRRLISMDEDLKIDVNSSDASTQLIHFNPIGSPSNSASKRTLMSDAVSRRSIRDIDFDDEVQDLLEEEL